MKLFSFFLLCGSRKRNENKQKKNAENYADDLWIIIFPFFVHQENECQKHFIGKGTNVPIKSSLPYCRLMNPYNRLDLCSMVMSEKANERKEKYNRSTKTDMYRESNIITRKWIYSDGLNRITLITTGYSSIIHLLL